LVAAIPAFKLGRRWALAVSAAALILSAWLYFPMSEAGGALSFSVPLGFGVSYSLLLDGLSLPLCWLTALLTLLCAVVTRGQPGGFWAAFLALEGALMGVFLARDLFLFYVFWEAVLIPMFFIIGKWGSENRKHAAMKFFLFTFFGGTFLLLGALALVTLHYRATGLWTWDMSALKGPSEGTAAVLIFSAIAAGLAVKIPLVPLHTWLPDAHTEAPAAGSVMLAGVMLKMGVYGILRLLWPIFPVLTAKLMPWLGAIAAINCVYGALCAMAQSDLKRLIAYSSVAHLGFCVLGVVSGTAEGVTGGSLQMLNHGLTTGALFFLVGFLYDRAHTREISRFGGLIQRAPWLTFLFGFSVMASIGLPGLNGFVGEFLSLAGMARVDHTLAFFGVVGVTLAAAYSLPAFQQVFWAAEGEGSASAKVTDLDTAEKAVVLVLCALMLAIGLYPTPLLKLIEPAVKGAVWF
jgi:NADH-quinone oxidoreductase subunit M